MPRRTVRKPTRWTAEEWARVTDAARPLGIPALRFVREAALEKAAQGTAPAPPRRRRPADELVHQLARVLNNLRQLQCVAEEDGQDGAAALIEATAEATDAAIRAAPGGARDAAPLLAALVPVGVALNELAHRANTAEELPPEGELLDALAEVEAAVRRIGP
jgi:mobilization protein NikA